MKRLAIALLILSGLGFGETKNADVLPSSTGFKLGNSSQRWDAFMQNVDISGNFTLNGVLYPGLTSLQSANLKSVFTLVPLPCGCHVTRDSRAPGGMNRDLASTQACVVTAGSRDG